LGYVNYGNRRRDDRVMAKFKAAVGQVYRVLPEYKDSRWIWKVKILNFNISDAAIVQPIEWETSRDRVGNLPIRITELKKHWELCPEYIATKQFDQDLEELLK